MKFILGFMTILTISLFVYATGEIVSKGSQSTKGIESYLISKGI